MTFLPTGGDGLLPRILQRVGLITRNRLSRSATVQVLINLEQLPHPDNRIVLSKELDELGVPRPELHWEWRTEEQEALHRLRTLIAGELGSIGSVQLDHSSHPDPNAHHHAGTTRMHADPAQGVVDPDGKVHGMENVFVTGSSILPSAGFANPALTIVALALRLADHLIRR
jgi:choline dehydrogenase-like flavoprotein